MESKSIAEIDNKDNFLAFLQSKVKDKEEDPDEKWITTYMALRTKSYELRPFRSYRRLVWGLLLLSSQPVKVALETLRTK